MPMNRGPVARRWRWVWILIAVLSIVIVAACVVGAYEIIHLRHQVNGLQGRVNGLESQVTDLYRAYLRIAKP